MLKSKWSPGSFTEPSTIILHYYGGLLGILKCQITTTVLLFIKTFHFVNYQFISSPKVRQNKYSSDRCPFLAQACSCAQPLHDWHELIPSVRGPCEWSEDKPLCRLSSPLVHEVGWKGNAGKTACVISLSGQIGLWTPKLSSCHFWQPLEFICEDARYQWHNWCHYCWGSLF